MDRGHSNKAHGRFAATRDKACWKPYQQLGLGVRFPLGSVGEAAGAVVEVTEEALVGRLGVGGWGSGQGRDSPMEGPVGGWWGCGGRTLMDRSQLAASLGQCSSGAPTGFMPKPCPPPAK